MEYGVMTTNKFKFLSDDETEDPFESLAKAEQAKKVKPVLTKKEKKAAVVVKPVVVVAATPPPKAEPEKQQRQANKENESRENRGPRGGGGGPRGGNARGGNRVNFAERKDAGNRQSDGGPQDAIGDRFGENRPPRGGGRGGGGRGGGFRGGAPRRGYGVRGGGAERQVQGDTHDSGFRSGGETEDENRPRGGGGSGRFRSGGRRGYGNRGDRHTGGDRHSGSDRTGVRAQPKREGYGKGNWGTENDELAGETEPVPPINDTDAQKSEALPESEVPKEVETDEPKPEEEEKIKELTLEEWKALHQKAEQPAFHIRQAGEGQDQKIYSKLVPLKKEEEHEDHEEVIVVRREPREKPLNIEVSFSDANRPRGGGGGERGFRGGRDRDDFRGGRDHGDRNDFRGGRDHGDRSDFRGGRDQGERGDFRGGRGSGERRDFRGGRTGRGGGGRNPALFINDETSFPALGGKA